MFTTKSTLFMFSVLLLPILVSAHPVAIGVSPRAPSPSSAVAPIQGSGLQAPLTGLANITKKGSHTLQDLYQGNQKFRNARLQEAKLQDEAPSFMFLGCADNRISSSSIFNTPIGSTVSHNNIANQYSNRDSSANAAIAYAVESLNVQHIIVLGHYGCKGVETAITQSTKVSRMIRDWLRPISALYSTSRRREIVILRDSRKPRRGQDQGIKTAPPTNDAGFRALVEENVKHSVKELRKNSILTKAYSKRIKTDNGQSIDIFVHGFVYDEGTGDVRDLHVSFGPPGKAIPNVPFKALSAAKNFHRDNDRPGFSKGKSWDFGPGK